MRDITAALAGLALSAGMAVAQDLQYPSVTDATAPVPPANYRSVFTNTPAGVVQDSLDWKRANADVGQFRRGHVDILKWEAEQAARKAKGTPSAPDGHMQHRGTP